MDCMKATYSPHCTFDYGHSRSRCGFACTACTHLYHQLHDIQTEQYALKIRIITYFDLHTLTKGSMNEWMIYSGFTHLAMALRRWFDRRLGYVWMVDMCPMVQSVAKDGCTFVAKLDVVYHWNRWNQSWQQHITVLFDCHITGAVEAKTWGRNCVRHLPFCANTCTRIWGIENHVICPPLKDYIKSL